MSSHHIVREKQEPALYIHEFGCFDEEYLGQLLEWSPTVLVNAQAYEKVVSLGIKIDAVVGALVGVELQEDVKIIPTANASLFEVLDYLVSEKYPAVNVISSIKHFDDYTCFLPHINLVLFTERAKYYAIKNGFSVWKPRNTRILVDIVTYFEADNLYQETENEFVVAEDGMVVFRFQAPYLFIGEYL